VTQCPGCGVILPMRRRPYARLPRLAARVLCVRCCSRGAYSDSDYFRIHQLRVDTYAVQYQRATAAAVDPIRCSHG
jgi:hypothetical protein